MDERLLKKYFTVLWKIKAAILVQGNILIYVKNGIMEMGEFLELIIHQPNTCKTVDEEQRKMQIADATLRCVKRDAFTPPEGK